MRSSKDRVLYFARKISKLRVVPLALTVLLQSLRYECGVIIHGLRLSGFLDSVCVSLSPMGGRLFSVVGVKRFFNNYWPSCLRGTSVHAP